MNRSDPALILRDCRILDGLGHPSAPRELWIAGGRIIEPGLAPPGQVITLGGRVIAPGLIDAHVHLCLDAGPDPLATFQAATQAQILELMQRNAGHTLRAGVTTVRDLGAPTALILALRSEIANGRVPGPRLIASGAPLTVPGGHLQEMGYLVRGVDAAREAVRAQHRAGVDVIKIIATGGGSSPETDPRACQFTDAEMQAIAESARLVALPVACHAHADAAIRQAVAAGVQSIEHGSYATEASLSAMDAGGVALVPTLLPAIAALTQALPPERRAAILDRFEARRTMVRDAAHLRVRIVAGTDAGVAFVPHGGVAAEIQALADCGLSAAQAMAAAGREAAALLGRPDLGTLVPGAPADLIVLEDNPLDDLSVLDAPVAVMQMGRWTRPPGVV